MQRNAATSTTYLIAAAIGSLFVLSRTGQSGWLEVPIIWLCAAAPPLLFVFAYPRFLFSGAISRRHLICEAVLHCLGAISATIAFTIFSPFWKNPIRDVGEPIFILVIATAVPIVFLAAAVSLLFRNKSELARVASILLWPYWFVLALACEGRWYQDGGRYAACYFLCFITPVFFSFAAGALPLRPRIAHVVALLGILCIPSLYWTLKDSGLGNAWVMFNQPDDKYASYPPLAVFGIGFVALLTIATVTPMLRLLPNGWQFRDSPVSVRTWPAFVASLVVMTTWFCQSVMPYRIPGAVDYSSWPILQILHVEKHGLQFHDAIVSVDGFKFKNRYDLRSVRFAGNDRRILQYSFREGYATAQLTDPLREKVRVLLASTSESRATWDPVQPVRNWNADNWYVMAQGGGLKAYTAENGLVPPSQIVDLFNDLEKLPRSDHGESESRDVCLGLCYDPISEMGYLYANHRCHTDLHGSVVCR